MKQSPQRWLAAYHKAFYFSKEESLILPLGSQQGLTVPYWLRVFFDSMSSLRSIEDHADAFLSSLTWKKKLGLLKPLLNYQRKKNADIELGRGFIKKSLIQVVEEHAESPVLWSCERIKKCIEHGNKKTDAASEQIASIGIVTGNRPESFARCLRSYAKNLRRFWKKRYSIYCFRRLQHAGSCSSK